MTQIKKTNGTTYFILLKLKKKNLRKFKFVFTPYFLINFLYI